MKTKKLNRYQKKIKKLESELQEMTRDRDYYMKRSSEIGEEKDKEIQNMKSVFGRIEGSESLVMNENRWLKETLSLLIVPADKLKELEKLRIERLDEEMSRNRMRRPF